MNLWPSEATTAFIYGRPSIETMPFILMALPAVPLSWGIEVMLH